jgi:hypothetical protein
VSWKFLHIAVPVEKGNIRGVAAATPYLKAAAEKISLHVDRFDGSL